MKEEIEEAKEAIEKLMNEADSIYDKLCDKLELSDEAVDWVFDYVFNNCEGALEEAIKITEYEKEQHEEVSDSV